MTGPEKTGLIYPKYTCSYYGIYLLIYMRYAKSLNLIEILKDSCIHDDILDTIKMSISESRPRKVKLMSTHLKILQLP